MEITYTQKGDYLYPDLVLPPQPTEDIGRFGRMRKKFLKEHQKDTFALLLMENRLQEHLIEINRQVLEMIDTITEQTAKAMGVTEELKASDPMRWVQMVNNIKASAEEIVLKEVVCK